MAKPTILKERGTGEELYPHTLASLVHTSTGENVEEAVDEAKFKVFVDMWKAKGGPDKVSDFNEETKLFKLYDIDDIDYEEALRIDMLSGTPYMALKEMDSAYFSTNNPMSRMKMRTLFPIGLIGASAVNMFYANHHLEVLCFTGPHATATISNATNTFAACEKLRRIIGRITFTSNRTNAFGGCKALEEVSLHRLAASVSFADSPLLSLSSVNYLVANAANTSTITITVHADVYAKLTGDTTNAAAAALTEEEAAAWRQVLADANAKNISFACP